MTVAIGRPQCRVFLLALAALSASLAPAAADERISARFEMFGFAGLPVLTLHTLTQESGERYAVAVNYATKGLASLFADLTTFAQARGRLAGHSAQPEHFRNDTRRDGVEHHSRVEYRPDGRVDGSSTPPPPHPVPAAAMRGTVDNLTAYFRLERQLARTGRCAMTARVFDGRQRYDLVFSDAGRQKLSPRGGQNFAGETIACHMTRRDVPGAAGPETQEGASAGTIWYANLIPGDLMVPVRMRLETQLGSVDGFLAELHASGIDLQLID